MLDTNIHMKKNVYGAKIVTSPWQIHAQVLILIVTGIIIGVRVVPANIHVRKSTEV